MQEQSPDAVASCSSPCAAARGAASTLGGSESVGSTAHRVHAVHDFWADDDNPILTECVAGIFLRRRRASGDWEVPEHWPIECRSLAILATSLPARHRRSRAPRVEGDRDRIIAHLRRLAGFARRVGLAGLARASGWSDWRLGTT